jgi:hypothetical protein
MARRVRLRRRRLTGLASWRRSTEVASAGISFTQGDPDRERGIGWGSTSEKGKMKTPGC